MPSYLNLLSGSAEAEEEDIAFGSITTSAVFVMKLAIKLWRSFTMVDSAEAEMTLKILESFSVNRIPT